MEIDNSIRPLLDSYFNELRQLSQHVHAQLTSAVEVRQALGKSVQNAFERINADLAHSVQLATTLALRELSENIQKAIQSTFAPAFKELQRVSRELPPLTQRALLTLGAHGWYVDFDMSMEGLWELERALIGGNVAETETLLCEYFEKEIERIETAIVARFPHRARLINAAFSAHRREEYALSIPVLLAQTDGICKETMGQYLFMKKDKKPLTALYVEQALADSFQAALLSPLAQTLPINASEKDRPKGTDALNRHEVLHGIALDYDTAINSHKAVSLVNYVTSVVSGVREGES